MFKAIIGIGEWLLVKVGLLPRRPRTTEYFYEPDVIQFVQRSRKWIRNVINAGRPLNKQGGLDWTREEYIAYALARPTPTDALVMWDKEESLRTARFRRHEMFANDNIDYVALADCLWQCELVSVNGRVCTEQTPYPPLSLVKYCEKIAPWLPKPPNDPSRRVAA